MSWGVSCIGKPEAVAAHLEKYSGTLIGQSKVEYDDALPHLIALVRQNFADTGYGHQVPTINFSASGSGLAQKRAEGDVQLSRNCTVKIEPIWTQLV